MRCARSALVLALLLWGAWTWAQEKPSSQSAPSNAKKPSQQAPCVQIAILLDTSNSMDGLINQARAQIWKIVNQMAQAKLQGQEVELQVALFQYGNDSLPAEKGYIELVVPFTDDLDLISDRLFGLTTNGGQEYCGQVIQEALRRLKWSKREVDLKMIIIAGNEPFTQGPVDPFKVCSEAIKRDITVTTIHCGSYEEGVQTGWARGARLADGTFLNIDQNAPVAIATPFDRKLAQLNEELNSTYLFYGRLEEQQKRRQLQLRQDRNSAALGRGALANRVAAKASRLYSQASVDLVDAVMEGKLKLEDLPEDQLPEQLRKLPPEKRKQYLEQMIQKRRQLRKQIREINKKREQYLAKKRRQMAEKQQNTFDDAVLQALRKQAERKQLELPKP